MTLLYNERPPYLVTNADGSASGLTGTPAARAFTSAGISFVWEILSTDRQIQSLRKNASQSCAIGWFHKPDREVFAKFTKAIYRDQPFVVIANRQMRLEAGAKLINVLSDRRHRVLLKNGFSYGDIDEMMSKAQPNLVYSNGEVLEMLQMLKGNRADMMFAAREEAEYLVRQAGFNADDFQILQFPDSPPGKTRHIMCSKSVPDETIKRLNAAIQME
ncbi:transporter substrate-binding domain-containing protein [Massilia sp. W12]|uniref:transporter substrate-binding domain-containing protein n=1 Tax=Massilia sp. W12 TaxID=3126507 RepID=UPI0030D38912